VAEAGLGQEDDAVWHWHVALNLDREALSDKSLASFGKAGELLARHPLRGVNEAPPGWTVLRTDDPAGQVQPDRKLQGELPLLTVEVGRLAAPRGLDVQVVVDAGGSLREPVVISGGAPGMIWETLEGMRSWRYEPARTGNQAVAVFRDLSLHPPARTPLLKLATLSPKAAKVEALLRSGSWLRADKSAGKAWDEELNDEHPSRARLAAILTLRALAEAGAGERDAAICRWQAAQHLDKRLYNADLSSYGAAGAMLERNRWGVTRAASGNERVQKPELEKKISFAYPSVSRKSGQLQGIIVLAGIVDQRGAVRQPVIVQLVSNSRGDAEPVGVLTDEHGALNLPRLLAISALDSLCDWRFRPATEDGKAVAFHGAIPVSFNTASLSRRGGPGIVAGRVGTQGLPHDPRWDPPVGPRAQPGIPVWW